jgi:hypothetical protein
VERLIVSIRRECLAHVIVINESSLERTFKSFSFTAIAGALICSLGKDAPQGGQIQTPDEGEVIEIQQVGGLHHHYERRIALPHHNLSGGYLTAVDAAATCRRLRFSSRQVNKFVRRTCRDTRAYSPFLSHKSFTTFSTKRPSGIRILL